MRTDEIGAQQCDVAGAAAEVEDLHAPSDAGRSEELPRERTVDLVLEDQAPGLGVGAAERISVDGGRRGRGGRRFELLRGWE